MFRKTSTHADTLEKYLTTIILCFKDGVQFVNVWEIVWMSYHVYANIHDIGFDILCLVAGGTSLLRILCLGRKLTTMNYSTGKTSGTFWWLRSDSAMCSSHDTALKIFTGRQCIGRKLITMNYSTEKTSGMYLSQRSESTMCSSHDVELKYFDRQTDRQCIGRKLIFVNYSTGRASATCS